jgi:hypothetical protein
MPAVVNNTEGSFSGMREADGIIAWLLDLKKFKYALISSFLFIVKPQVL